MRFLMAGAWFACLNAGRWPQVAGRKRRAGRWLLASLVVTGTLLLSACGVVPTRQLPPATTEISAAAHAAEAARQRWLAENPHWSLQGRAAISKGRNGGSGRVDWRQQGTQYRIQLSAPVTRQSWVLQGDAASGAGRLEGLEGGPRAAEDAEQLLLQATGWQIPVNRLPQWLRGVATAAAEVELDAEARPLRLREQGWEVDFLEWYPAQGARPALPRKIEARSGDAKVRLLVDQWSDIEP